MNKTIQFELNEFATIPHKLRESPTLNQPSREFEVDLGRLFHHYYCDSYGVRPPDPNPANFEYLKFLASCPDFRFIGDGPGASTGKKRSISAELGQAFCRYFLYEFCGITYFAHMDRILNKTTHPAFGGLRITRLTNGDVPDYLCARSAFKPYIAEAKGRFYNISFASAEFDEWRHQFERIAVLDKDGIPMKLKGYITGTKFTSEHNLPSNKSVILAEDPQTLGDEILNDNEPGLGRACIALHYSRLISKLGLNLISDSLDSGFTIPPDLQFNLPIWRCIYPALDNATFVGGYFSESEPLFSRLQNGHLVFHPNIFKLGLPSPTFYGIEIEIFRRIRQICQGNWSLLSDLPELPDSDFRLSNLSWLRDGSITGPLEFFEYIETQPF